MPDTVFEIILNTFLNVIKNIFGNFVRLYLDKEILITPNAFSYVDDIPAALEMQKPDRIRCMSILHHLNGKKYC